MDSSDKQWKNRRNFWVVFVVLVTLAAVANLGNLYEYNKINRLNAEGKRVKCAVDSIAKIGSKTEVHMRLVVGGKMYHVSQKVKSLVQKGDSIAVYYLEKDPSTNSVVAEE